MKKMLVFLSAIVLAGMMLLCLCYPKQEISETERRKLSQFPELTWKSVSSGKFMESFEEYAADQFPFREIFRTVKSGIVSWVFGQSDNNDLYMTNGHLVKMEYPLNEDSVQRAASIFQNIYESQLKEKNCNVYYSIIPDKNYFLGEDHLRLDYGRLDAIMQENLKEMTYIDIKDSLEAEDYYKTDVHWRQECLLEVAEKLASSMETEIGDEYQVNTLSDPFYGVYYGQAAYPVEPDTLHYLTSERLEGCVVYDFEHDKEVEIYDMEKAAGLDPYEIFLSGSISLLGIRNPNAASEKHLVIFRDSFGSAIAPLLTDGYAKITLVDIRYLPSARVGNYVDFQDADVLFLYSTTVLNESKTLK